jgi:hypothetical protein
VTAIDAIIANASAKVAGATRDAARSTGARFDDLLIAAPGNHPVSVRTASNLGNRRFLCAGQSVPDMQFIRGSRGESLAFR